MYEKQCFLGVKQNFLECYRSVRGQYEKWCRRKRCAKPKTTNIRKPSHHTSGGIRPEAYSTTSEAKSRVSHSNIILSQNQ